MMRFSLRALFLAVVVCTTINGCRTSPSPIAVASGHSEISLHEMWLAEKAAWRGVATSLADTSAPVTSPAEPSGVALDDPSSVVSAILRAAAPRAVVYPTEGYFYWEFPLGHRLVRGNLRFVDIESGVLHYGYFDDYDPGSLWAGSLAAADGLEVTPLGPRRFRVSYCDVTVEFELSSGPDRRPDSLRLTDGEEIVSGIVDESGLLFWLIWNEPGEAFYYVVDDSLGVWDELIPVEGTDGSIEVGGESRFVFLVDRAWDRRVLIGVWSKQIRWNTYFDGPFDQVPPRLPLKDKLERAYPYVNERGGIDEHGNFVALEAQRVAISPYAAYESLDALAKYATELLDQGVRGPDLWLALTHEWKRDFLRGPSEPRTIGDLLRRPSGIHAQPSRQGWPANHSGAASLGWPPSHFRSVSGDWPPDHDGKASGRE